MLDQGLLVLVAARQASGLSVETVAERMGRGFRPEDVEALEGGRMDPHVSTMQRYARSFGGRVSFDIEWSPDGAVEATPERPTPLERYAASMTRDLRPSEPCWCDPAKVKGDGHWHTPVQSVARYAYDD